MDPNNGSAAAQVIATELGANWIDTAPVYGTGHSEEIVASALKEWRGSRPYVLTKCVMRWDEKGRVTTVFNRDLFRRECADSLRRLQVDLIDLYQMHWPPADNGPGLEEAWQTMAGLQKEGKVRWIGVSNFTVAQIERAEKIAPVISLQPPYSLIHRQIETENTQRCREVLWLPFLDTYRTMCLAPQPDFRRVLEDVGAMQLAVGLRRELINNAVGRLAWVPFGAVRSRPSRRVAFQGCANSGSSRSAQTGLFCDHWPATKSSPSYRCSTPGCCWPSVKPRTWVAT